MPVPDVPRLRLYVLWLPRPVSVRVYDGAEPTVTWPLYWVLPVPLWMACHSKIFLPVEASVTTCSSFGVPSCCRPPTTVSYASVGSPCPIHTTLRGARSASVFFEPSAFAAPSACFSAAAGVTSALVSTDLS